MHHHLKASGETCHWGFFDATLAPRLTIKSGDTVTIDTVTGPPEMHPKPEAGFFTPPEIHDVHRNAEKTLPGHILTGPVAVEGAKPGDVLEVRIDDVQLRQDWGYTFIRPLAGTLPEDFDDFTLRHIRLDRDRLVGQMPWGGRSRIIRQPTHRPCPWAGELHATRWA
jgi:acetamidase/formamidase